MEHSSPTDSGRRSRATGLTVAAVVVSMAIGFLVGFIVRSRPEPPVGLLDAYVLSLPDSSKISREQRASSEKRAIAIVLGETRSDGMTYGEFVKTRRLRQCPTLNPKGFDFVASPSGAFPPRFIWVWDVYLLFDGDKYPRPCDVNAHLASLYSDTAKVFPVDSEPGEIDVNIGSSGPSPSAPSKASWLIDFRTGRAP